MTEDRNRNSVLRQLAALQKMPKNKLREKWRDLYGTEPPGYSPGFMRKRLIYRVQELFYGGLPEHAAQIVRDAKKDAKKGKESNRILPGTRFVRVWNGTRYEVITRQKGFEYNGCLFRSLSAVATKITGVRWNGPLFFGLRGNHDTQEEQ